MVSIVRQLDCSHTTLPCGAVAIVARLSESCSQLASPASTPPQRNTPRFTQIRFSLALVLLLCMTFATTVRGQNDADEPFAPDSLQTALPDVLSQGTLQPKARLWFSDRNGNLVLAPEEFAW